MLELHMIPTGGDATLIRFIESGSDINILIDGGNRKDDCLSYLNSKKIRRIHLLIASHLDEDHIRGLRRVANEVQVDELWITDVSAFVRPAAESLYMLKCVYEAKLVAEGQEVRNKMAVYEGFRQQLGPFFLKVLSPPKGLHDYLRRPAVIQEILRSPKGQTIRRYVQDTIERRLREAGNSSNEKSKQRIVSQVIKRFDVDVPQKEEIERLIQCGEVDWRELDKFFESARSLFNDISIVVKITFNYKNIRETFLFPGDLTNWSLILASYPNAIRGCVLKVPHHGGEIFADRQDCLSYWYAQTAPPEFWKRLSPRWRHLWEEWYFLLREYGVPPVGWFLYTGEAQPWLPPHLDSEGLYEYLRPKHALIYPYKSSFRLPRLDVRNAIKANSQRVSCNFIEGKAIVKVMKPEEPCMECFGCEERKRAIVFKWSA